MLTSYEHFSIKPFELTTTFFVIVAYQNGVSYSCHCGGIGPISRDRDELLLGAHCTCFFRAALVYLTDSEWSQSEFCRLNCRAHSYRYRITVSSSQALFAYIYKLLPKWSVCTSAEDDEPYLLNIIYSWHLYLGNGACSFSFSAYRVLVILWSYVWCYACCSLRKNLERAFCIFWNVASLEISPLWKALKFQQNR